MIALQDIDNVIMTIKKSQNNNTALKNLKKKFNFTTEQASAILSMRFSRLTSLQRKELLAEAKKQKTIIKECDIIISSREKQSEVLINELSELNISMPRRTEITTFDNEQIITIPNERCVITITKNGYVKNTIKKDIELHDDDEIIDVIEANTHDILFLVSKDGQTYGVKMYDIPDTPKGTFSGNLVDIQDIVSIFKAEKYIVYLTRNGLIKKTSVSEYNLRKSGVTGIKLIDDEVVDAFCISDDVDILCITHNKHFIRFNTSEIPNSGRNTKGVKAIKLKNNDYCVGVALDEAILLGDNEELRIKLTNYKKQSRAGVGVKSSKVKFLIKGVKKLITS